MDRLHPCKIGEGPSEAYCGQYSVFENRSTNTGRQISLKIVVAPGLQRNSKPDPLFMFEGGPGMGAATLAADRLPLFHRYQVNRDIVFIDQRGTGASNPLDCDAPESDDEDLSADPAKRIERIHTCLAGLKGDARLYTTAIATDDFDEVRKYLGYDSINIWGGSYGTRTALVYLKRHEGSVRSVILDAVAPPDMRLSLFMPRDGQRALDNMIADCAKDAGCGKQFPHLNDSVAAMFANAASGRHISVTHPRTGKTTDVPLSQRLVANIIYSSLYDPTATSLLPLLITNAARGDYQGLLALAFAREAPKMSEGMFLSVVCSEDFSRISPEDIAREAKGRFLGTTFFDARLKPCEFWPKATVAADYYQPVASSKPVLILSGADDPITPPVWGESAAKSLSNSKHIVVPGSGHISTWRGCVPQLVGKFLDEASVKDLDAGCVQSQHRPPFFLSDTGVNSHD